MTNQVVKVKRDTIAACMTCPLCNKLLRDATTITECLHTFCRKCIYDKISEEEIDCCPVCYTDLGAVPPEKLRPDHNLQSVRAKIFPFKKRKVKAHEVVPTPAIAPPVILPPRRKERSLSELVGNTQKVSTRGARVVAESNDVIPTSRSMWTEVHNFKKRLELMFPLCDVEAGQAFKKSDGRFKSLQMMAQSLCMAYGNALKDEERDVELEKLKEELNRIEDRFSDFSQAHDMDGANLDLVQENADLREEIASVNNDRLQLRAEREIIQEELGRLRPKLSVAQHKLEEEQTKAREESNCLFEENLRLHDSLQKQEKDRQIEREASATTNAALQSEVGTLQREREQDRKIAVEAHDRLNQTNQDLQARLEQIQKELKETRAAMKKQEDDRHKEREASATTNAALQSEVETLQRAREQDRKTAVEAHDRLNQTNQDLQARFEQIQKELKETRAAVPGRRSIVENWSRSRSFHYAARYYYGYYMAVGYAACRMDILEATPDYDITKLRFNKEERFLTTGMTLLEPPKEPLQICFDDEGEGPPNVLEALLPVYSQEDPYDGEVLPLTIDDSPHHDAPPAPTKKL